MTLFLAMAFAIAAPSSSTKPTTPAAVSRCGYRIVETYPHDRNSFTQGLFWDDGHLYEGTGQYGRSRVARLDLKTGKALSIGLSTLEAICAALQCQPGDLLAFDPSLPQKD